MLSLTLILVLDYCAEFTAIDFLRSAMFDYLPKFKVLELFTAVEIRTFLEVVVFVVYSDIFVLKI